MKKIMHALRQTGRTTRMLQAAIAKEKEISSPGKRVVVLAPQQEEVAITRMLKALDASSGVVVCSEKDPIKTRFLDFDPDTKEPVLTSRAFEEHGAILFVDHSVFELELVNILYHLHRFDETLNLNSVDYSDECGKVFSLLRQTGRIDRLKKAIGQAGVCEVYTNTDDFDGLSSVFVNKNQSKKEIIKISALPPSTTFIDPLFIIALFYNELKLMHEYDMFIRV